MSVEYFASLPLFSFALADAQACDPIHSTTHSKILFHSSLEKLKLRCLDAIGAYLNDQFVTIFQNNKAKFIRLSQRKTEEEKFAVKGKVACRKRKSMRSDGGNSEWLSLCDSLYEPSIHTIKAPLNFEQVKLIELKLADIIEGTCELMPKLFRRTAGDDSDPIEIDLDDKEVVSKRQEEEDDEVDWAPKTPRSTPTPCEDTSEEDNNSLSGLDSEVSA